MSKLHLYNFLNHDLPDSIPELLSLLGLFTVWDRQERHWRVYQIGSPYRLKWNVQQFKGGSTEDWRKFLSSITSTEHLK